MHTVMFHLTPKQTEAMRAVASEKYNFILFGGAMGGGKTIWGLIALLVMCRVFPKSRWCVVRRDLEKIRTTTIPSFRKLKPGGQLRENPYQYTHPNGSVILFKSENYAHDRDLQWMRGLEVNGFLFEEINECTKDALDLAFSRAGRWECNPRPKPVILATCNPGNNWVKQHVYDRHQNGTLPPNWLYIPSKITDNPHLTPEYIEGLKNMPRYKYEVLVNGNWDLQLKTGGEFYKCFEPDKHIAPVAYNAALPLHISWDDNVNPYLPCGIFQIEDNHVRMIDEIALSTPANTVQSVCNEFMRRYPGHTSGLFIYGDATAAKQDTKLQAGNNFYRLVMQYLAQYQPTLRTLTHNPGVTMRGNWLNTVFEKQLHGLQITIAPHCTKTIADFTHLKEAPDGTKLKTIETDPITHARYQKYGHFTDLFDYLMVSAFAAQFKLYQTGGVTTQITHGKNLPSKNAY